MSATLTTRARNLRPGLAQFEQFMRDYVKPPVGVVFENLVTNGTFDADSDWSKLEEGTTSNPPTISGGVATIERVDGTNFGYLAQEQSLAQGVYYRISLDISGTPARVRMGDSALGTQALNIAESNVGVGREYQFFARASNFLTFISGTNGVDTIIDNVSLWEANPDNDNPWLRLPRGMTVDKYGSVYRDNDFLQRDEYYLRNTGDPLQWFVEPKTAPGASTRFEVFCSEVRR